jgi:hypothetical protein
VLAVQVIVENRRQARKVRIVLWFSAIWCIGWLYWAYDIAETYGLSPGDGGVLRPPGERWAAAAIMASVGIAPLIGMIVYARRYLTRLVRDGKTIAVSVLGVLGESTWSRPLTDVTDVASHRGQLHLRSRVDAPWITLRIAGRRYIIDLQSELVNRDAIDELLRGQNRSG